MKTAECKTSAKARLLIEACNLIDQMQISQQNQDLRQGDLHVSRFAGVVARVEGLRGRMFEAGRQVEGLFESVLSESFQT